MNKLTGLKDAQVIENRKKYGSNKITGQKKETFFSLLLETLQDPIIKILIIALLVKVIFLFRDFDWFETLGILIAIFLASFISTISEYGSEKAFEKLQEESSKIKAKVIRNGQIKSIAIDDIVKDDIVLLESGDKIPADGILIKGNLVVDESSLTGEMKEIYKDPQQDNLLYRGTVIFSKTGYLKVTKVGNDTYYGKVTKELTEKKPDSPLKLRLAKLAKIISKVGYVGAFLGAFSYLFSTIFIANNFDIPKILSLIQDPAFIFDHLLHALTLAVTIIIVAVPEGLPMMVTLVLSSNMKRMLKRNVLVRKLVGIETSGSLNMLFFDKTGTITKGRPEVTGFLSGDLKLYKHKNELKKQRIYPYLKISLICNNESKYDQDGNIVGGNLTDKALLKFMQNEKVDTYQILDNEYFDSSKKYAKTVISFNKEELVLYKGATEVLLAKCHFYYDSNGNKRTLFNKNKILDLLSSYASQGSRILLLAIASGYDSKHLTLLGFLLIKDEVREDASKTIEEINKAGIRTIMITGDNKDTASAIAKEVGLLNGLNDLILTSKELERLNDQEIAKLLPNLKVVARALPTDKSRLVKIAEEQGFVVGMTGDGVNDAIALKKADVGFAMGSGTEIAKEASDIVLLDDSISSIAQAILFGRTIFKSIRKFIVFQLSLNICATLVSVIGPIFGIDNPITVMQMLWINMIMDTLAALAFSYEAPLPSYMEEAPKKKEEDILNFYCISEILVSALYSSILCFCFLKLDFFKNMFRVHEDNLYFMTGFFALFIFMGIFNSFNARTPRLNLLANITKNKVFLITFISIILIQLYLIYFGGNLFRTYGLTLKELEIIILLALSVILVDFIRKIFFKFKKLSLHV